MATQLYYTEFYKMLISLAFSAKRPHSKSDSARSAGSIPARGTKYLSETVRNHPEIAEKPSKTPDFLSEGVRHGVLVSGTNVGTIVGMHGIPTLRYQQSPAGDGSPQRQAPREKC